MHHKSCRRRVASLSHAIKKWYRVNRPLNNCIHFHLIYQSHLDNVLAFRSREMLHEAATNHRGKISKTLGTSGMCYGRTNIQATDSKESTFPWQHRLKRKENALSWFGHRAQNIRLARRKITHRQLFCIFFQRRTLELKHR